MTKDVLIRITGYQYMDEEGAEPVEVITTGEYFFRNGKHYLSYDEVLDESDGITKNLVKISDSGMEIQKKGAVTVTMQFDPKQQTQSSYHTPYGMIPLGIETDKLDVNVSEELIDISVAYRMEMNFEPLSENTLTMIVQPRSVEGFLTQG